MFNKIFAVAGYTFKENVRNKVFYVLILFTVVIFAASMLFGILAQEQQQRMLQDMGLVIIELFTLLVAIYAGVTLVLEEVESKTIYAILTRPVPRWNYILGRYLGILAVVVLSLLIMSGIHLTIMKFNKWNFSLGYLFVVANIGFKISLILAISFFFALFSTSAVSGLAFTSFFWILGHFSEELKFMSEKVGSPIAIWAGKLFYYLIPNFQYYNFRDRWDTMGTVSIEFIGYSILYLIVYVTACLFLTNVFFSRKEF